MLLPFILQFIEELVLVLSKRQIKKADLLVMLGCTVVGGVTLMVVPELWRVVVHEWLLTNLLDINNCDEWVQ